jgi:hypothetical protein
MKIHNSAEKINDILARTQLRPSAQSPSVVWGFSAERIDADHPRTPWWLWWNILSFDAPAVAVAWASLFARSSGGRLPAVEGPALVLSVWTIYTTDRLLDGWSAKNRSILQERHLFCDRHRLFLATLVTAASALVLWLMMKTPLIPGAIAGLKLGAILVFYMAGIHAGRARLGCILPKEISVGLLFASGVTLPVWSQSVRIPWRELLPWALFGLLCSLNCLSIEYWENHRQYAGWQQPPHPFVRWAAPRINGFASALAIAALTVYFLCNFLEPSYPALIAISAAAFLLLLLNCLRAKLSSAALRFLADLALLVPALIALLLQGG